MSPGATTVRTPFFRQLSSGDNSRIANLHTSEAAGSRTRDQDTLRTQDDDSTMQRTQMPPLDEISNLTASKAAMAAVLSSTGMQDYGNPSCQQDAFGTSTESSLAGVQDEFGSISGQHPRRSSGQPVASQGEIDIQYGIWYLDSLWEVGG